MIKGQGEGEKSEETRYCMQSKRSLCSGAVGRTSWRWEASASLAEDKQDGQGGPHRTWHAPLEPCRFESLAGCEKITVARAKPRV